MIQCQKNYIIICLIAVVGGLWVMTGFGEKFTQESSVPQIGSTVYFLVQTSKFNVPLDQFVIVSYDRVTKHIAIGNSLSYASVLNAYGTNVTLSIDGVLYEKALALWSWQSGRYQLFCLKDQKGTYQKVIWDSQHQHVVYTLTSELCWGGDGEKFYAVKGLKLLTVNPATGESKELLNDVSSFIVSSDEDALWTFDKKGNVACRNKNGQIITQSSLFRGVVTGSGRLDSKEGICYVRRNEHAKGHLVVLGLASEQTVSKSFDMPQCSFLKIVNSNEKKEAERVSPPDS